MSRRPVIVTLQIFPLEDGVRVDLGTVSAPEEGSPRLKVLSDALATVAVSVITRPDLGILGARRTSTSLCPASPQPTPCSDEEPTQ